ncbi:hypothetical protein SDC9_195899 [bioreactor metagenome]|uniref:Uncharacterized protein n=1 Tax=bioreactor metagenome TaxID=1076179 RepID=A0A645IBS9_9ZZZZ
MPRTLGAGVCEAGVQGLAVGVDVGQQGDFHGGLQPPSWRAKLSAILRRCLGKTWGSGQRQRHVDVAARGVGVGADLVCGLHQCLGGGAFHAG